MSIEIDASTPETPKVIIQRPEKLNALDPDHIRDLTTAFQDLSQQADVRAIVLTGVGKAFVGGADISHMAGLTPETARAFIRSLHDLFATIRACPTPVIAAVNGYCLGAGMELAAVCDIRLGADTAMYGMPEVKVGVPSVVEAAVLPRLMGTGRASWLVLTGDMIDARRAADWGFVEETLPDGELMNHAMKVATGIAAAGPQAVRAQKRLIRMWEDTPVDEAAERSIAVFGAAFDTDEPKRLMASFAKP